MENVIDESWWRAEIAKLDAEEEELQKAIERLDMEFPTPIPSPPPPRKVG
jgi:hypothetical protein